MTSTPGAPPPSTTTVEAIELELYKSLRAESQTYLEKVPALWLQKFATIGAALALVITEQLWTGAGVPTKEVVAGVLGAITLVCMMIDAKVAEFGIHCLVVSRFLRDQFAAAERTAAWEDAVWAPQGLTLIRSVLTIAMVVLPTVLVVLLAGLMLVSLDATPFIWLIRGLLVLAVAGYVAASVFVTRKVWGAMGPRADEARARP